MSIVTCSPLTACNSGTRHTFTFSTYVVEECVKAFLETGTGRRLVIPGTGLNRTDASGFGRPVEQVLQKVNRMITLFDRQISSAPLSRDRLAGN